MNLNDFNRQKYEGDESYTKSGLVKRKSLKHFDIIFLIILISDIGLILYSIIKF